MRSKRILGAALALGIVLGLAAPSRAHVMFERVYDPYDDTYVRTEVPHRHRADGSIVVMRAGYATPVDPYYARPYGYRYDPYHDDRFGYAPYYRDNNLGRQLLGSALGYAISRF